MNTSTFEKLQYNELKEIVKAYCVSSLGKDRIDKLIPNSHIGTVNNRLKETSEGRALLDYSGSIPLQGIINIDKIIINIEKGVLLDPEELTNVSNFLRGCRRIKSYLKDKEFYAPTLYSYSKSIVELKDLETELDDLIRNNRIDSNASKELKRIRRNIENTEVKIEERLQKFLKSSVNRTYIQDFYITKRQERYTIPIKVAYKNQVSGTIVDTSSTGSTVFIEPSVIHKYTNEMIQLKSEETIEEYQILSYLTGRIVDNIASIKMNVEVIAEYDMIFAKARFSKAIDGIAPKVNDYGYINIIGGKHPLLEGEVVPLDFTVGKDYRTLIITGPNAGGKTIVLKAVGLLTLAIQSGFHISAKEGTHMSVFDKVFVDIGDDQSIENALSTFSSHVKNIAQIINHTDKSSLLLFDEIGSGTEPNEGAALAIAVLEEVYNKGAITVATTHYGEIKNFSYKHPDFENAAMKFNSQTLEPLYQLLIGKSGESNALWISKKMGIGDILLKRAKAYIENKEYNFELVNPNKIRKKKQEDVQSKNIDKYELQIGDRVFLSEYQDYGIVYKEKDKYNNIVVFFNQEFITMNERQIKLDIKAEYLYPKDYNVNDLFISFQERKLEKDIMRGSKKTLKKLRKERM